MRALWSRWTQQRRCLFLFLNLATVLSDSTRENFANICQIKWNWTRSSKFEAVQIHFLSDVFGLLSFKNFVTTAMLRNDFSSLLLCTFFSSQFLLSISNSSHTQQIKSTNSSNETCIAGYEQLGRKYSLNTYLQTHFALHHPWHY